MTDPLRSALVALEHFAVPAADSVVHDSQDLRQIVTPSVPLGPLNAVTRSILGEEDLDERIDAALAPYRRHGGACWWILGPESRPPALESALVARGFRLEHAAVGMIAPPEIALPEIAPSRDAALEIRCLTEADVDDYIRATRDEAPTPEVRERLGAYLRHALARHALVRDGDRVEFYYALHRGEPAGTGVSITVGERHASLSSGFVRSEFRGRGIYRALVAHRLARLRERGFPTVAIISKVDTSAPILARLGFRAVCELRTLELRLEGV